MKLSCYFILLTIFFLLGSGLVWGVECASDLATLPCNYTAATGTLDAGLTKSCMSGDCIFFNTSLEANLNGATFYCNDSNQDGCFFFLNDNVTVLGRGSEVYGNTTTDSKGYYIRDASGTLINGVTLKNFYYGILAQTWGTASERNLTIEDSVAHSSVQSGLLIINYNDTIIDNVTAYNTSTEHGIYFSNDPYAQRDFSGIKVLNSNLSGNKKNGIQFNSGYSRILDVNVSDNILSDNEQSGINNLATDGGTFEDNTIYNNTRHAITLAYQYTRGKENSSVNNIIRSNTVYDNYWTSWEVYNWTYGNIFLNNTYDDNNPTFRSYITGTNYTVNESTSVNLSIYFYGGESFESSGNVTFIYSGLKSMQVVNNSIFIHDTGINFSIWNNSASEYVINNIASFTLNVSSNEEYYIESDCIYPYEDLSVTTGLNSQSDGEVNLCVGAITEYNLNDSNANGAIIIGGDGLTLDINNASIFGNSTSSSRGIYALSKQNVTIKNANISSYAQLIRIDKSANVTIQDSIGINGTIGFWFYNTNNSLMKNNYVYLGDRDSTTIGLESTTTMDAGNNTIIDNIVEGYEYPIRCLSTTYDNVSRNNISNYGLNDDTGGIGIYLQISTNNTYISQNRLINGTRNGIGIQGYNNIIEHNYVENFLHNGIDIHDASQTERGGNCIIRFNEIRYTSNDYYRNNSNGIFIAFAREINLTNNSISDMYGNSGTDKIGISVSGGEIGKDIIVQNNTVRNMKTYCISDESNNTLFKENTFSNCGNFSIRVDGNYYLSSNITRSSYIDNNYLDGHAIYQNSYVTGRVDFTLNETSSSYHLINLSNLGIMKLPFNGRKSMTVENNTIRLKDLTHSYSYNQVWLVGNSTDGQVVCEDDADCNVTKPANNRSFVFMYSVDTQPKFFTISTGVTDIDYSYTSQRLDIECTGTGSIVLENMQALKSSGGYYDVLHDGVFVQTANTNTYTISSCSAWTFYPNQISRHTWSQSESYLFFLVAFMIVFGSIWLLMNTTDMWTWVILLIGATIGVIILRSVL